MFHITRTCVKCRDEKKKNKFLIVY